MLFHSVQFFLFFAVTYALYLVLGHRAQNRLLLVASYIFYASWDWRFLSLILITTLTDYFCARAIEGCSDKSTRKRFVAISCVINLGILAAFKYFNFFIDSFVDLFNLFSINISGPEINIILPVGISFYTFQSISYTLDVYRKQIKPTNNILDYALYVTLFPQLIAGPIERGKNLLPQILSNRVITVEKVRQGLFLIVLGLFKKLFIADNLGAIVDPVFMPEAQPTGSLVLVAGYAFLFQIYCDFSAYTDIARGTSKLMGFELMENFRAPFLARNIQEFWNRWHISLTTWVRDYLYYPLAFKRFNKKSLPPSVVVIISFTILGLWHGAAWGFVVWGIYNGIFLAFYGATSQPLGKLLNKYFWPPLIHFGGVLITFHIIFFGTLFFRAASLDQALSMINALIFDIAFNYELLASLSIACIYILPIVVIDWFSEKTPAENRIFELPRVLRYLLILLTYFSIAVYGSSIPTFIYFQF